MTTFFSQYGVIGFIGTAIFGLLAFYGLFDRRQRTVRKEGDDAEDRARKLLREEVTELTKKVAKQESDIKLLVIKIDALQNENSTLREVLQGRDGETKQFYQDMYKSMGKIEHNDQVSEANSKILAEIAALIKSYVTQK